MYQAFTFHYASTYTNWQVRIKNKNFIYIPLCLYLYKNSPSTKSYVILPFTFHYASTYTGLHLFSWLQWPDLHSTMPLLIPAPSALRPQLYQFTFHYASTYTAGANFNSIISCILFTNPTLLQRFGANFNSIISCTIYIPLCLYLYRKHWVAAYLQM